MLARRLNNQGTQQLELFLHQLRDDPHTDAPRELLTDPGTSAPLDAEVNAEPRSFHSRLEVAEHLARILKGDSATLRNDAGFWNWLSLCWFDELCPQHNELRNPGESARWIADLENPRRTCRHFLAGPFQIYWAHRDDPNRALSLLCGAVHQPGPLVTTLAARPSLVTCNAVVGAATRLYYNRATGRNRSGLAAKTPGSPKRFADVLSQLDLTWDLHSLTVEELLDLLPAEFDHFHRDVPPLSSGPRQLSLLD